MKTGEIENCEKFEAGSGVDIISPSSLHWQQEVYRKSYVHVKEYRQQASRRDELPSGCLPDSSGRANGWAQATIDITIDIRIGRMPAHAQSLADSGNPGCLPTREHLYEEAGILRRSGLLHSAPE